MLGDGVCAILYDKGTVDWNSYICGSSSTSDVVVRAAHRREKAKAYKSDLGSAFFFRSDSFATILPVLVHAQRRTVMISRYTKLYGSYYHKADYQSERLKERTAKSESSENRRSSTRRTLHVIGSPTASRYAVNARKELF